MNYYKEKCPECGSKNIVNIIYGLPTEDMLEAARDGVIEIGDKECSDTNPKFKCKDCKCCWGGMEVGYIKYNDLRSINLIIDRDENGKSLSFNALIDFDDKRICWYKDDPKLNKRIKFLDYYGFKHLVEKLKRMNLLSWAQFYQNEHKTSKKEICKWEICAISKYGFCYKRGENAFPREWNEFINLLYSTTKDHDFKLYCNENEA